MSKCHFNRYLNSRKRWYQVRKHNSNRFKRTYKCMCVWWLWWWGERERIFLFNHSRHKIASGRARSSTIMRTQSCSLRLLALLSSALASFSDSCWWQRWLPALSLSNILFQPQGKGESQQKLLSRASLVWISCLPLKQLPWPS